MSKKTIRETVVAADIVVQLGKIEDPKFLSFCLRHKIDPGKIPNVKLVEQTALIAISGLSDEQIAEEFEQRDMMVGDWLGRVYRYLAENDSEAAMEELYARFRHHELSPPAHERAVVDRIQGYRRSPC